MSEVSLLIWVVTLIWFVFLILGDLFLNRNSGSAIGLKQSVVRSVIWISLGAMLGLIIWLTLGHTAGTQYFYGFVIEKSLSLDNIFVWGVILSFLNIPKNLHYQVLFWGVIGAIFFRTLFVVGGAVVIARFEFVLIILGIMLLYTTVGLFKAGTNTSYNPANSRIFKFVEKHLPFTNKIYGSKLVVKIDKKRTGTLLLFAIIVIELTDILFAIDSVPAVLAVVRDPYIALTSNIAAILGLRALYFVFENVKDKFWLLNYGLMIILGAVGISLIFEPTSLFGIDWFGVVIPSGISLAFVTVVLMITIFGSIIFKEPKLNV